MKALSHIVIFLVIFLANIYSAESQHSDRFARNVTQQYGLPTQTVYDLHIDSLGYLYLGTDLGLFRFNGTRFQRIPSLGNVDSAIDNIVSLNGNKLWAKNFANQLFYLENDTLKVYEPLKDILGSQNSLNEIFGVGDDLFLASRQKVMKYNSATGLEILVENNEAESFITSVSQLPNGNMGFIQNDNFIGLEDIANVISLPPIASHSLHAHKGEIYTSGRGINKAVYNFQKGQNIDLSSLPRNAFIYFLRSTKNKLWLCTSLGLYEVENDEFANPEIILENSRVSDIVEDREGNFWVSTLDAGIYFFPNFKILNTEIANGKTGKFSSYTSITNTPFQTLLVGTNDGHIIEMNLNGQVLRDFDTEYNIEIEFIFFDQSRNRIICTNGSFDYYNPNPSGSVYLGKHFMPDDEGNFLIAHSVFAGLVNQDFNQRPNISFSSNYNLEPYEGFTPYVLKLVEARAKTVYFSKSHQEYFLAAIDDLYLIDKDGNIQNPRLSNQKPLVINAIVEDGSGRIWLGSSQKGLVKWEGGELEQMQVDGLGEAYIKKLILWNNQLYILSNNDLYKYDIPTGRTTRLPVSDIFSGLKINDLIIIDNEIWVTSNEGVHTFKLNEQWNSSPPTLINKGLLINGQKRSGSRFTFEENSITLLYDLIHLGGNGSSTIKYRIQPNAKWEEIAGSTGQINFASMSPGKYQIQFQGIAKGQSSEIYRVPLIITPPWWQSPSHLIILALLFLLLLVSLFALREKSRKRSEEVKLKLAQSQIKSLRSQMNPHFIFNILNAVQGFIYTGQKNNAAEYLSNFSALMRSTLELSDKQVVSLNEELDLLNLYISLELPRFDEKVDYQLTIEDGIDAEFVKIPSLLLQPFVENALKHGLLHKVGNKLLKINISKFGSSHLIVQIEDNGIGREASQKINIKRKNHSAFGTNAIFSRIELINQTLKNPIHLEVNDVLDNGLVVGTIVKIKVPIHYG